jgi:hypothetical protein
MGTIRVTNACIAVGYLESERNGADRDLLKEVLHQKFGNEICGAASPFIAKLEEWENQGSDPSIADRDVADEVNEVIEMTRDWASRNIAVTATSIKSGCKPVGRNGWANTGFLKLYQRNDLNDRREIDIDGRSVKLTLFLEWTCEENAESDQPGESQAQA